MVKSCCVTGHREYSAEKVPYIKAALQNEIIAAINDGYRNFISGFAPGVDMLFAQLVASLMDEYPRIILEAALPYPTWMNKRHQEDKDLLCKCKAIGVHSPKYGPNCFLIRNRFMVNTCERVIAVYDGRDKGGTVSTMRYASALERDLRVIEL